MSKTKVTAPIAARPIAIDGKHFAQGEKITGVDQSDIETCIRLGSVVDANSDEGAAAILEAEAREEAATDPKKKG